MSYASDNGLEVGDKIIYTGKGACLGTGNFNIGDELTLEHDDGTDQPKFTSGEGTAHFWLKREWKKVAVPVTKATIFNLESTGEEAVLLRVLLGSIGSDLGIVSPLFKKTQVITGGGDMYPEFVAFSSKVGLSIGLVGYKDHFQKLLAAVFPESIVVKSQDEIEYEKLQEQIKQLQIQSEKFKPKGSK